MPKKVQNEKPKIFVPKSGEVKNQIKIAGNKIKKSKNKDFTQAEDLFIIALWFFLLFLLIIIYIIYVKSYL